MHVTVSAADSDGTVTQVQYYDGVPPGAHLLGTLTTAPFSTDLLAQVAGDYTVVAVATDNSGAQTSSSLLSFTVNGSAGAAQVFYIHTDQLDTPRLITDSNNSAVWRWDNFDAFGDNPPNDDPSATGLHFIYNPRFAGQYFDQETRLNYNYFRDYDTGTGRYIESDPIGLNGGINTYLYSKANPLKYTDRKGLEALPGPYGVPIPIYIPSMSNGSESDNSGENFSGLDYPKPRPQPSFPTIEIPQLPPRAPDPGGEEFCLKKFKQCTSFANRCGVLKAPVVTSCVASYLFCRAILSDNPWDGN